MSLVLVWKKGTPSPKYVPGADPTREIKAILGPSREELMVRSCGITFELEDQGLELTVLLVDNNKDEQPEPEPTGREQAFPTQIPGSDSYPMGAGLAGSGPDDQMQFI